RCRAETDAGRTTAALATARALVESAAPDDDRRRRAAALRRLGNLLAAEDQPDAAIAAYREALGLLGPSALAERAELCDLLAFTLGGRGRPAEAEEAVAAGLDAVGASDPARHASLLNTQGTIAHQAGEYARAEAAFRAARRLRRGRGRTRAAGAGSGPARGQAGADADTLYNLALVLSDSGRPAEARHTVQTARRTDRRARDWVALGRCAMEAARACLSAGDPSGAGPWLAEARGVHLRSGHAADDWLLEGVEGYMDYLSGDLVSARLRLARSLAAAGRAGHAVGRVTAALHLAAAELESGRPGPARAAIEEARRACAEAPDRDAEAGLALAEGRYHFTLNRPEDAARRATAAMDLAAAARLPPLLAAGALLLARAELRSGAAERGRTLLASARRLARAGGDRSLALGCVAAREERAGGDRLAALGEREALRLGLRLLAARLALRRAGLAGTARAALKFAENARRLSADAGHGEVRVAAEIEVGRLRMALGDVRPALVHFREALDMVGETIRQTPESERDRVAASPVVVELREQLRLLEARLDARGAGAAGAPGGGTSRVLLLHRVLDLLAALNSTRTCAEVLGRILQGVFELTRAERGFLALGDSADRLDFTLARNHEGKPVERPGDRVSRTICRHVMTTGRPLVVPNAQEDESLREVVSVKEEGLTSVLCVPFKVRERVLGVFYVDNRHRPAAFAKAEVEVLEAFAHQAALALENARLAEATAAALAQAEGLAGRLEERAARQERELVEAQTRLAQATAGKGGGDAAPVRDRLGELRGRSAPMQETYRAIERAAAGYMSVLILGETGTGKERIAQQIHRLSPRSGGPFVAVNCAALPPGLEEAELFGAAKGAYTGAVADREGLLEAADKGTLFLDEVATMPAALQAKFLRVLEDGQVRRLGGTRARKVDFRVLAATNEEVAVAVRAGRFREDRYYRLRGEQIRVAPLRERRDDLPLLAEHFLAAAAEKSGKDLRRLAPGALELFLAHAWPGNVRELENAVHALAQRGAGAIGEAEAAEVLGVPVGSRRESGSGGGGGERSGEELDLNLDRAYEALQQRNAESALRRTGGNRVQAARLLGVTESWLHKLMNRYGIR
ncbi:MAG: sigma 54-interacting transcriptional regulator, partial [Planctomycetes bacterium]|nr:sigma 54-interacting transcriptional regulator [Planctomycetota bacterium]